MYCYRNPLAFDPATGDVIRHPWYDTTCCPPNLERTFAALPGYFISTSKDGIYVHLYDASEMNWHLEDGTELKLVQETGYPWNGDVHLAVSPSQPAEFTVFVRIPGWSSRNAVHVNGDAVVGAKSGEYLAIRRRWREGDKVQLSFDMTPLKIEANPAVLEDVGKFAMQRGPIVFCMEELDQKGHVEQVSLYDFAGHKSKEASGHYDPDLLGGVYVIKQPGSFGRAGEGNLYHAAGEAHGGEKPATLTMVPYYAWANRAPSPMQVWIPLKEA
jgi:DUF1680 family protein